MKDKIIIITAEKKMEQKLEPLIRELGDRAVVTFSSGEKAAEYISSKAGQIDLIILSSFYEAGVFSYQFAEKIKSKYQLPIIFLNNNTRSFDSKPEFKAADLILSLPENELEQKIFKHNLKEFLNNHQIKKHCQLNQYSLDSLSAHIAVLDENGVICYTNKAWEDFARENALTPAESGLGINYLELLKNADEAENAADILAGIKKVMAQESDLFSFEYPCHSPENERWFKLRVTHYKGEGPFSAVVAHENITERKKAEKELEV
ncbi:MAG: hypothetical protein D5S01_06385, partial [Halanaerobium sp. MSAO_Bac5]